MSLRSLITVPRTMSQRNSGYDRKPRDLYETPEWVTSAVAPYLNSEARFWEPACASGRMAKQLIEEGLEQAFASDLVTRYGTDGMNFLTTDGERVVWKQEVDLIISNPPFNKAAEAFIRRGLDLMERVDGQVAMLLPVDFDSAKTRRDIFEDHPAWATKLVLTSRIVWFDPPPGSKGKSPSQNHAWYIWDWSRGSKCMRPANIEYHFKDE